MGNRVGTCWRRFQLKPEEEEEDGSWSGDRPGRHWPLLPLLLRCLPCLDHRCSGRYLCCLTAPIDARRIYWPRSKCLRSNSFAICGYCCCSLRRSCADFRNAFPAELFYSVSTSCDDSGTRFSPAFPSASTMWPLRIASVSIGICSAGTGSPVPVIAGSWKPFAAFVFCPAMQPSLLLRYLFSIIKSNSLYCCFNSFSQHWLKLFKHWLYLFVSTLESACLFCFFQLWGRGGGVACTNSYQAVVLLPCPCPFRAGQGVGSFSTIR